MNRIYRKVWNASLGCWVVASELAHSRGKRGGGVLKLVSLSALTLASQAALAQQAPPDVIDGGEVVTIEGTRWDTGGDILVGGDGSGTLIIGNGNDSVVDVGGFTFVGGNAGSNGVGEGLIDLHGTLVSAASLIVGGHGTGTVNVGAGATATVQELAIAGMNWDDGSGNVIYDGTGTVNITDGGVANVALNPYFGSSVTLATGAGSNGALSVSGAGSQLNIDGYGLDVGFRGIGELRVENGGVITAIAAGPTTSTIGTLAGATGTVTVSGSGSAINLEGGDNSLAVGYNGNGTLNVEDGGAYNVGNSLYVGHAAGSSGTVNVSGGGTSMSVGRVEGASATEFYLGIGDKGTGTLNIVDGAVFSVANGGVQLGIAASGSGTLNLSNATLEVGGDIQAGAGAHAFNIADGRLRLLRASAINADATLSGEAEIAVEGADALWSGVLSGSGAILKSGAGTLTLAGANSYSGGTTLAQGRLRLGNDASLGTGVLGVAAAGTVVDYAPGVTIANPLELSADVTLSATEGHFHAVPESISWDTNPATGLQEPVVHPAQEGNAPGQAGAISGDFALTKTGAGELVLSNAGNSYSGGTFVEQGGLVATASGALGSGPVQIAAEGGVEFNGAGVGAGELAIDNRGSLALDEFASAASASIANNGGYLYLRNDATLGSAQVLNTSVGLADGSTSYGYIQFQAGYDYENGQFLDQQRLSRGGNAQIANEKGAFVSFASGGYLAENLSIQNRDNSTVMFNVAGDASGASVDNGAGAVVAVVGTPTYAADGSYLGRAGGTLALGSLSGEGTVILGNNTLVLGGRGGNDRIGGTIADNGTYYNLGIAIDFASANAPTAGSSGGALVKIGAGTLTLTGVNSYSGGTTVEEGALAVERDANLGSGGLTLDGGTLRYLAGFSSARDVVLGAAGGSFDTAGNEATLSGTISGVGALSKLGEGRLTLAGDNSYSGGTVVDGGILRLEHDNALGSGGLRVTGAGALVEYGDGVRVESEIVLEADAEQEVAAGNTVEQASAISGSGALVKSGDGVLILSGDNSYTGGTSIAGGMLVVGKDGSLGDASGGLALDGGTLRYAAGFASAREVTLGAAGGSFDTAGNTATLAGSISGAGALVKTGDGTLVLSGDNRYEGGTAINGGALQVERDANLGGGNGGVALDGGTLVFAAAFDTARAVALGEAGGTLAVASGSVGLSGPISGDGGLTKSGAGTLVLGGANSYGGGTTVVAGTLVGDAGSLRGDLRNEAEVVFEQAQAGTYDGAISGSGSIEKTGEGRLWLSGDSSGFTGQTTVSEGTLRVNGVLGGSLDVAGGAVLDGIGTIGTIAVAGSIGPGNSIGTLTVAGSYTQAAGSTYVVEIAADGRSDRIEVEGQAVLQGGTVQVLREDGVYRRDTRYTILSAGQGVSGTFEALAQSQRPFLDLALVYGGDAVWLDVLRNSVRYQDYAASFNALRVAEVLDAVESGELAERADLSLALESLSNLAETAVVPALNRLSGEIHAGVGSLVLDDAQARQGLLQGRGRDGDSGAWVQGWHRSAELDGDGNAHGAEYRSNGALAGLDTRTGEDWLIGAAVGYTRLDADFQPGDRARVKSLELALYGRWQGEAAWLDAGVDAARLDSDVQRHVGYHDIARNALASYRGHRLGAGLRAGYDVQLAQAQRLQPSLGLRYDTIDQDGFEESGAGDLSLRGQGHDSERLLADLGLRWSGALAAGSWTLVPQLDVRWNQASGSRGGLDLALAGAPELGFHARGLELPERWGSVQLSLSGSRGQTLGWYLGLGYQRGDGLDARQASAGVHWRW
ncbi:MAG TPA: hypothetical protein DDZ67_12530 [Xanthomonadaceae bacterium]|nr:hypothetical protein [Xanthomonadaceae bacterium]